MANKNGLGSPKPSCKKTPFYRVTAPIEKSLPQSTQDRLLNIAIPQPSQRTIRPADAQRTAGKTAALLKCHLYLFLPVPHHL
jgi:hypothetical protein